MKLCWLSSLSNTLSFSCNCAISDSETTDLIIALELKICRISSLSLVGKFWFIWMLPSKGAYITVRNVDCNDSISDWVRLISLLIIDCDRGFFVLSVIDIFVC